MGFWPEGKTILHCSYWDKDVTGKNNYVSIAYVIADGKLAERKATKYGSWMLYKAEIDRWFEYLGRSNKSYTDRFVRAILQPCVGKTTDELDSYAKAILEKNNAKRALETAKKRSWEDCDEDFKSFVVGLDSTLFLYDAGFSVRLVISSARSFEERRNFVKRRGRDILKWTAQELMLNPRSAGQIGDIRFYKPVTIGVMRVPQIEIKYEVKDTSVFEKGA